MPRRLYDQLTARTCETKKKPGRYLDGNGLYLQVSPSGSKSWFFRYMIAGKTKSAIGKPMSREMGLGPYPDVPLATSTREDGKVIVGARDLAADARALVRQGIDPIEARAKAAQESKRRAASSKTFKECALAFIEGHRPKWKNEKHADQWLNTLTTYAFPKIGDTPVSAIDTPAVLKVIEPIWHTKTETASRLRGRIFTILAWAGPRGYRDVNTLNPAQWTGHLDKVLPKQSEIAPVQNMPSLPYDQAAEFLTKARQMEGIAAKAMEFLLLNGSRTGEVIYATWTEIDLGERLWSIPGARMKMKKPHIVPLSTATVKLLRDLAKDGSDGYIFKSPKDPKKPLSNGALLMLRKRMGYTHITPHGFRSTFSTWANDMSKFDSDTIEQALAHQIKDQVKSAYDRAQRLEKRRRLMEAWAGYCTTPKKDSNNVTPIRAGKRETSVA